MDETVYKIALAGFLHDIGKFMQRAELEKSYPEIVQNYDEFCPANKYGGHGYLHAAHTAYFIEHILPDGLTDKRELYKAARHHKNSTGDIYRDADCLSSGMERYIDEVDPDNFKDVRLHSIFDMVELQYAVRDKEGRLNSRWKHRLVSGSEHHYSELYPAISEERMFHDGEYTYQRLWLSFETELKEINSIKSVSAYFNELYWLLEKYTCCIPSATNAYPDISLFDHSKTTSAIASAIYLFKQEQQADRPEFILYGGDISGIQDYIFKISQSQGIGAIAKRLRGRSFYVSMFSEVLSRYIIDKIGLTQANINFCGGGNFELLLPNTETVTSLLSDFEKEVNTWLLEQFHGELGFVGAAVRMTKDELRTNYAKKKDILNEALAIAKQKKFSTHINNSMFWQEANNKNKKTICRSCNLNLLGDGDALCHSCDMDKKIGEQLPKVRYLSFSKEALTENSMSFGPFGHVTLWMNDVEPTEMRSIGSSVYALRENASRVKALYRLAKTAPTVLRTIELETEEDDEGSKTIHAGQPLSFSTLADMATGDKRIGILKMDVDNLGFIFSMGLDALTDKTILDSFRSISRLSTLSHQISAFFTTHLDKICERIFQKWQTNPENLWKHRHDVSNIFYLIFSGGDDLVIVGPWDMIIELAGKIRKEFKNFTCHNPNITLSAGIYICKPKFPISHAVTKAEEALRQSKQKGRNRITVMGETFVWAHEDENSRIYQEQLKKYYYGFTKNEIAEEKVYISGQRDFQSIPSLTFDELIAFAEQLNSHMKASYISRSFVRTLLEARNQYCKTGYNDQTERFEETHDMMFLPHLLYTIERNVRKEAKAELKTTLVTSGDASKYVRQALYPCKYVLMKNR